MNAEPETRTLLRAYRFTLDPTGPQEADLARYAGACRWAYNFAVASISAAQQAWAARVDAYRDAGLDVKAARAKVKAEGAEAADLVKRLDRHRKALIVKDAGTPPELVPYLKRELAAVRAELVTRKNARFSAGDALPSSIDMGAIWRSVRDLPREEGGSPWHDEVSTYCFTSGFDRAAGAFANWMNPRAGRPAGYPRFKRKGRARDSFALYHDVKRPTIRLPDYRHVTLPKLGTVRTRDSTKRLRRLVESGQAVVKSVTVSRGGHRWYASVLAEVTEPVPVPTRRQRTAGLVGVDLGSRYMAVLSQRLTQDDPASQVINPPKPLRDGRRRLVKAQQALSRTSRGSARRVKAARRVGRVHHEIAARRAGLIHGVTKRLATGFAAVAIEDLDLVGMTATARGSVAEPGHRVKVEATFNRHLLDRAPGEFGRQLKYKTDWYGSTLVELDRGEPTNATCSGCGARNPSARPSDAKFVCGSKTCGLVLDRHDNSARVIARVGRRKLQEAAPGKGEAVNARGVPVSLPFAGAGDAEAGRPPPGVTSRE